MEPRVIDLDAARRARQEVTGDGEGPIVTFGGHDFRLPNEMPFDFAALLNEGKIAQGIRVLLEDQADAFFALKPSVPDMMTLAEALPDIYGMDPGKSVASPSPSPTGGTPSRPTSNGSTVSTSV